MTNGKCNDCLLALFTDFAAYDSYHRARQRQGRPNPDGREPDDRALGFREAFQHLTKEFRQRDVMRYGQQSHRDQERS